MTQTPSVLVVGSINMDLVLRAPRLPRSGETLVGGDLHWIPGGKGANQAVAAARLGANVGLCGRLGADANGATLKAHFDSQRISTQFVIVDDERPTGLAVILLDAEGHNSILLYAGANHAVCAADVARALDAQHWDALMVQTEIPEDVVLESCRLARQRQVAVVFDVGTARPFPLEAMRGLEILTPNETEATALTGVEIHSIDDAGRAARELMRRSEARAVVVKLGARGALLLTREELRHFKAPEVEVVDTTAAGDAFTAALTIRHLQTGDLAASVAFANLAGALTVTRLGAQPSLPTIAELKQFESAIDRQ